MRSKIKKWLINFFKIGCPECNGKLSQDFIYIAKNGTEINVYTCDTCKNNFI